MNKFKVGDKVKYIKHSDLADFEVFALNRIYVIKEITPSGDIYLNTEKYRYVFNYQIELCNPCEKILQDILDA